MLVTELGITTDVRFVHTPNAPSPILVTELPITTDVNAAQFWNAN